MLRPNDIVEILEGLLKHFEKIQDGVGVTPAEFALANALTVLVSVMLYERQQGRE